MALVNTLARNVAVAKAEDQAKENDPSLHKARPAFFFLLVFTALLFGRPSDIFWSLQVIPLAQIAAIAAVTTFALALFQGGISFRWCTELKLVLALTIWFILGVAFAFWRSNSLDILRQDWMKTVIIFFLLTQVAFTIERVRKILWTIVICMLLVATYSLFFASWGVSADGRMQGANVGFLSGNYLGIAVGTTLPYIAVMLVRSRSFIKSMVLVSTFSIVMLMTVKTASRGNMIVVFISLALVWTLVLRDSVKARMMGLAFAGAIVAAILVAPGVFWDRLSTMWDKESYATSDASLSATYSEMQRQALLRRSIDYTLENPIFGVGLGNFAIVSGTMTHNSQEWKGTHNTFTQISSEAGIPALIMFLSLLIVSIRNMLKISRACKGDPEQEELVQFARATVVSLIAFMMAGFFAHLAYDYYLYYLVGFGVSLQSVYQRVKPQMAAGLSRGPAPIGNGRTSNGNGKGNGNGNRKGNGQGGRGRAW